jgi:hypothetical protein
MSALIKFADGIKGTRVFRKKKILMKRKEYKMFYKRSCWTSRIIIFMLCVFSSAAFCDFPVLENPSFEPDYSGWKVVNGNNYIGTHLTGGGQWWEPYAVSEISPEGGATDGDYYLMWYDSGVYQITDQTIGEHEMYYVSVDACQSWNAVIVKVDLGYEAGNNDYVIEETETFYPTRRLEMMDDGQLLYVGTWERFSLEYIPTDDARGKPLYIKIGNEDVGEWLAIDNVQLETSMDYSTLVYPPDKSTDIPIDANLEWTLQEGFTCDVYFGTEPAEPNFIQNPKVIDDEYATTHDPSPGGDLEYGTTYYWRVDPIDPNNGEAITYAGRVWTFTTISLTPVIVTDPASQTGEVVTLTVEAAGIGPFTYDWYKVGEPDTLYATTTEPSLTIDFSTASLDDEGYYYCTVTNDYGTSEPSEAARVMKSRMVGWWKMDGDLTDSVTEEVPGAPTHDGTGSTDGFAGGLVGDAAQFNGLGKVVTITDSGDYFNFYPQGMTTSVWVNCALDGTWDGVIGKQSNEGDWWVVGWLIGINDAWTPNSAHFSIRNPWRDLHANPDTGDINDSQWHLVAAVFEPDFLEQTCVMHLYIDGALKTTSDVLDMDAVLTSDYEVAIGNVRTHDEEDDGNYGDSSFHGLIDDVRIYNYPLEPMDVAMMYIEQNPGSTVCVDQNEPWRQFDVAGEPGDPSWCKVDIADMAEFASVWMNCNLLLECLQ